ncbi:AfsR/SARP family transcriptional regulator [Streptomyces sp. Rer75]|uniref:AfsR/SARP family transcriptional regulator n=1 Tax=Streptomyces sp. Rer75 TaxID=2750011 RepID=UPI0015CFC8A9|nr:AfsR/SARP family transcriptional regulator [Streptomyces sp. Rer75]QLH19367.1 AfsR/SARP family transcriptional regulator [Streptomyces sp. Rer75]
MLKFRVLGTIEIQSSGYTVRPKGTLQRALLATLLVSEGHLVPTKTIVDEIWGTEPPEGVENAVQAHISRLRRKLSSLEPGAGELRLVTHPRGYRLVLDDGQMDALAFTQGYDRAKDIGSPAKTASAIRPLLALWGGPVFGGPVGGMYCQAAAARYEEARLVMLEKLYDCELDKSQHQQIIPELRDLLVTHPYHERMHQQLMVALYRAGRQTEALQVYRELSARLADELGLLPSPTMQAYERAVLEQNPGLHLSAVVGHSVTRRPLVRQGPVQL